MRGEVWAEGGRTWAGGSARAAYTRGEGPTVKAGGPMACAERTENMPYMFVTLEVSKLSGWLNTLVPCRESERGHTGRGEVYGPEGGASSVQGRARLQITGPRHGKERTRNMLFMSLTLEVSTLSGWLNAYAFCRESKRGHTVRGGVRAGR